MLQSHLPGPFSCHTWPNHSHLVCAFHLSSCSSSSSSSFLSFMVATATGQGSPKTDGTTTATCYLLHFTCSLSILSSSLCATCASTSKLAVCHAKVKVTRVAPSISSQHSIYPRGDTAPEREAAGETCYLLTTGYRKLTISSLSFFFVSFFSSLQTSPPCYIDSKMNANSLHSLLFYSVTRSPHAQLKLFSYWERPLSH